MPLDQLEDSNRTPGKKTSSTSMLDLLTYARDEKLILFGIPCPILYPCMTPMYFAVEDVYDTGDICLQILDPESYECVEITFVTIQAIGPFKLSFDLKLDHTIRTRKSEIVEVLNKLLDMPSQ